MIAATLAVWAIAIVPNQPPPLPPPPLPAEQKKDPAAADPSKKDPGPAQKPPSSSRPNSSDAQRKRMEDEKSLQEAGKLLEKTLQTEKDAARRAGAIIDFCRMIQPLDPTILRARVFPMLQRLYGREPRPEVRAAILEGFQFLDVPQATTWLTGELRAGTEPAIRAAAAKALGLRRDATALPALHEKLTDIEPAVLKAVILALAEIRDLSSAPPLINVGMQTVLHRGGSAPKGSDKREIYAGILDDLVRTLQLITGENFGANQDEWQNWWNAKGRLLLEESKKRPPPPPVPKGPASIPGRKDPAPPTVPKPSDPAKPPANAEPNDLAKPPGAK